MQTAPHDSPGSLAFCAENVGKTQTGSPSMEVTNAGGVG